MKKIKIIFLSTLSFLTLFSCLIDDGQQKLEIDFANTTYTVGFVKDQYILSFVPNTGVKTVDIPIDLLGGENYSNMPVQNITFEIDNSMTTAISGTDFMIDNTSAIIQENRSFGTIPFKILTDNLTSQSPGYVTLNLLRSDNGVVAEQFKTTTIYICPESNLEGNYTSLEIIANTAPNATISEIAPGEYQISAMPYIAYGGVGGNPAYINFTDVCGELEWGQWAGGTLTEGTGYIDVDGSLVFEGLIIYNGNTADPNDIWFNLGPSTYTPN